MLDPLGSLALLALRILKLLLKLSQYLCNVARISHYSKPFHENQINAYLRTGARYICYYSSFCSYRDSCQLVGSNITFNFVLFCSKSGTTVLTGLMFRPYAFISRFRDRKFSFSNWLLSSQLKRVDLKSTCVRRR